MCWYSKEVVYLQKCLVSHLQKCADAVQGGLYAELYGYGAGETGGGLPLDMRVYNVGRILVPIGVAYPQKCVGTVRGAPLAVCHVHGDDDLP